MSELIGLWLPILVASVAVFFLSGLFWQGPLHHKADINMLPKDKEDKLFALFRELGIDPKFYMFPNWESIQTKDKAEKAKAYEQWLKGPFGTLTIQPGAPSYAKNLGLTFVSYLAVSVLVAYLSTLALEPGAGFTPVFQFAATAGVLGYTFAIWPGSLFFGKPKRLLLLETVDGVLYGLLTGAVFALLWPSVESVAPAIPAG